MAAGERRRQGHLDPAELKNLQTIVLDLAELKQFHRTAKRPGVRSILSREISNLESKIISDSTDSDEEDIGNVNLAETNSKKKRKGRGQPESSMMTKKPKLSAIKKLPVVNGSSCQSMEEELHRQQTRSSEQVLQENENISDVNEASHMEVLSTKNTDISKKRSQIMQSAVVISATGSGHSPSQKKSWCRFCEIPNHAESECCRLNGTCFNCHEVGHIVKNCPKMPRDAKNPSRMIIVTPGSSCESTQEELSQQPLPTKSSDQASWKKTSSADVNGESVLTIVATENTDVSNEMSQTMPSPATTVASEFKFGSSGKRKFRHTWHLTHDKSECFRCNGNCFNCHETGHLMANCPKLPQYTISSCGKIMVTAGSSCTSTQEEPNQESLPPGVSEQVLSDKGTSSDVNEVITMAVVGTENADFSKGKPNLCTTMEQTVIIRSSSESTQEEQNQQPIPTGTSEQVLFSSRKRSWCRICEKNNHTESECCRLNGTCFSCHEMGHIKKNCPKAPRDVISASDVNEELFLNKVATENADVSNEISQAIPQGTAFSGSTLGTPEKNTWCGRCKLPSHAESECARLNGTCLTCHEKGHFTANCPKNKARDAISHSGVKTSSVAKAKIKRKVPVDAECFYCKHKGHWKRSCAKYLADLKAGKVIIPSDTVEDKGS